MQRINQGSIIYGLRSEKYPEKACLGIVISARCDIANKKIKKIYYLTALEVQDWLISDTGFDIATRSARQNVLDAFTREAKKHGLNVEVLLSIEEAEFDVVINSEITKAKDIEAIKEKYKQFMAMKSRDITERKSIINREEKSVSKFLVGVNSGVNTHLYYMPAFAYREGAAKHEGLIIDLQEIGTLRLSDAESICNNVVDGKTLSKGEWDRYSQFCWIESEEDFTMIDGLIPSPWCEHLLQRFASGFTRIGIDGATEDDMKTIVNTMVEEGT